MFSQMFFLIKWFVTQCAGKRLQFFMYSIDMMNSINMSVQNVFHGKCFAAQCTGKGFKFIMNSINVRSHISFPGKWFITQCAGEMFQFVMNSTDMSGKIFFWRVWVRRYVPSYHLFLLSLVRFVFQLLLPSLQAVNHLRPNNLRSNQLIIII